MPDPIVVPLRSRRAQRAALVQKLQHAIPGVVLLLAGLQTLSGSPHGAELVLALFEVAVSVLLLGSMARSLRANRHLLHRAPPSSSASIGHTAPHTHHGIEWMDLFAAAVLIGEGLERKLHGHHFPRPTILTAATLIVLGLLHGRVLDFAQERRSIRLTDDELVVPGRPFKVRKLRAAWADLQSIDVGAHWAVITTRAGRVRKLNLPDLLNEAQVRAALVEAQQRIRPSEDPAPPRR